MASSTLITFSPDLEMRRVVDEVEKRPGRAARRKEGAGNLETYFSKICTALSDIS